LLSTGGQTLTPAFRVRLELQQASWPSNRQTAAQLPPQLNFTRNIPHHTTNNQNHNTDFLQTTPVTRNYQPHAPIHPHAPQTTHTHKRSSNGPSQGIPRDAARVRQGRPPVHHQVQQAYASCPLSLPFSPFSSRERERVRSWTFADMRVQPTSASSCASRKPSAWVS
jgi:hypothetical protein